MDALLLRKVDDLNTPNESGAFVYIHSFIHSLYPIITTGNDVVTVAAR